MRWVSDFINDIITSVHAPQCARRREAKDIYRELPTLLNLPSPNSINNWTTARLGSSMRRCSHSLHRLLAISDIVTCYKPESFIVYMCAPCLYPPKASVGEHEGESGRPTPCIPVPTIYHPFLGMYMRKRCDCDNWAYIFFCWFHRAPLFVTTCYTIPLSK